MDKCFKRIVIATAVVCTGACTLFLLRQLRNGYLKELNTLKDILDFEDVSPATEAQF